MSQDARVQLFDEWAQRYDASVRDESFPLAGYESVLSEIARAADVQAGMSLLDLGIGTGNLAARFAQAGCAIWGIDFSSRMLEKARERLPQAQLIQADLLGPWSAELSRRFDRIVSAYVLHHFELAKKVELLERLANQHLATQGRIVIGDVSYPTVDARQQAQRAMGYSWEEDEYYWAADEAESTCARVGLQVTYRQVSTCGGVFIVQRASQ
jgi:putative AdoMet-dependent methyltransferase